MHVWLSLLFSFSPVEVVSSHTGRNKLNLDRAVVFFFPATAS
jgi:hypothetical protein